MKGLIKFVGLTKSLYNQYMPWLLTTGFSGLLLVFVLKVLNSSMHGAQSLTVAENCGFGSALSLESCASALDCLLSWEVF